MWTVDPQIPMSLWWALAIAAAVSTGLYAWRRSWPVTPLRRCGLMLLHVVGLLGPLLIALNPTWVETIPPASGTPMLTVLVDGTLSMQTDDVGGSSPHSRWSEAVELASRVQAGTSSIDVRKLAFGELVKPLSPSVQNAAGKEAAPKPRSEANTTASDSESPADSADALASAERSAEGGSEHWPQGHRSDLAMALRQAMRSGSPQRHAILMISDGAHNAGAVESVLHAAREANALSMPVYTLTLGTSVGMKNMSLAAKTPRMIAFPKKPLAINVSIGHSGLAGQTTQVSLIKGDTVIETKSVRLTAEPVQEVRFVLEKGAQEPIERYHISASEVKGEVTTADNQSTVLVQRLNAPIGALVLEGKPYWDSKFLARNLSRDPVVDLTAIVRLGPGRYLRRSIHRTALPDDPQSETPTVAGPTTQPTSTAAPETAAAAQSSSAEDGTSDDWAITKELESPLESMELLDRYRLVILGRDAEAFLSDQGMENLRRWLSQSGGCLLCARGAPTDQVSSKLAELLPVRWSGGNETRIRPKVTRYGIDSSVFEPLLAEGIDPLGSLPSLAVESSPTPRPGLPQVLVEGAAEEPHGSVPIVTYQPYGSGQTIVVEGAGMWRWAFLAPQHAEKDKIYPTLWQSMVQWIISQQDIMPGQELAVRADRATFLNGDRATASVSMRDPTKWLGGAAREGLSAVVQSAAGELPTRHSLIDSSFENGLQRVDLGVLPVGFYTLKIVRGDADEVLAATAFEVRDPWFESLEVDARPDIMSQIARLSGGRMIEPDQVAGLVEQVEKQTQQQQKHAELRTSMWDRPIVLFAILVGWISTWIIRRQSGLV